MIEDSADIEFLKKVAPENKKKFVGRHEELRVLMEIGGSK